MSAELPAISAFIARLADPEINLAAYGSVVFPLALIIESPVIMLLAASTALSRDFHSYRKLRVYMMTMGATLTGLHLILALTPLFDMVVGRWIGAPAELLEPSRIGFLFMTPWTWSIAYRRFNQGILIRFGRSKWVGIGTGVRLTTDLAVLAFGSWMEWPGVVVATSAIACGVIVEAAFVARVVKPVILGPLAAQQEDRRVIDLPVFVRFYFPLATTSLLLLSVQPLASAAMSRMAEPLLSLAIWPVAYGLLFVLRSPGLAYQEVVVALIERPGGSAALARFAWGLTGVTTGLLAAIALTPAGILWFGGICGLAPDLAELGNAALWLGMVIPGLCVLQNWLQGILVDRRRTRGITESVLVFLGLTLTLLAGGTMQSSATGIQVGLAAFSVGSLGQTAWLVWRVVRTGGLQQDGEEEGKSCRRPAIKTR